MNNSGLTLVSPWENSLSFYNNRVKWVWSPLHIYLVLLCAQGNNLVFFQVDVHREILVRSLCKNIKLES